jgi:hypothetical protein
MYVKAISFLYLCKTTNIVSEYFRKPNLKLAAPKNYSDIAFNLLKNLTWTITRVGFSLALVRLRALRAF